MKKLIQKWLEIPEKPKDEPVFKYVNPEELKELIEGAIYEALQPDISTEYEFLFWNSKKYKNIRGILKTFIDKRIDKDSKESVNKFIDTKINTEKFIDEIVERIKVKQL